VKDKPKVVTSSVDNTIRLWDFKKPEIDVINVLEAPESSEISSMTFLPKACLVATGHEDGVIRLWNLEISSSVVLKSTKGGKHSNTISCLIAQTIDHIEYLIAGSYDGTISVWEISSKDLPKKKVDQDKIS
jgi:WD40 repeat protein